MAELNKPSISPALQALYANEGEARNRAIQIQMGSLTADMYKNFYDITSTYPGMSKDLIMSMVKQGLTAKTPGIDKIVSLDGIAQLKKDQFNVEKIKKSVKADRGIVASISDATLGKVYDIFKGATRAGFALLRTPYDLVTTLTRDALQEKDAGLFVKDLATLGGKNTLFGSLIADVFGGKPGVKTGAGFFIDPESRVGKDQAKAMRAYGKVNGESFTIGRFFAKSIEANPDKTGYRILSGFVDASLNLALDPTFWFGAGSARAILKGAKQRAAYKAQAKEFSPAAQVEELNKEIAELAKESEELIGKYTKRSAWGWMSKTERLQRLEKEKFDILEPKVSKLLNTYEDAGRAFSQDELAQQVLSGDNIVREIINNPAAYDGELLRGIDKLAADSDNTLGFIDGYIALGDLPKKGVISFGADRNGEYLVTLAGDKPLKVLDLTEDISGLSGKAKQAEVNRRMMFEEWLEAGKTDVNLPAEVRAVLDQVSTASKKDAMELNGFSWAVSAADKPKTMADILMTIAAGKQLGGAALAMEYAMQGIQKIWKPEAITNYRAIYGEVGGAIVIKSKRLAGKRAEVGFALSEIADPSNLGPNIAKLLTSVKTLDATISQTRKELEAIAKNKEAAAQRVKEIEIFKNVVDQDIDLRRAIINDPEYKGLEKVIDLEAGIAEKRILREWYQNNIGVTNGYKGDLGTDFSKAFKFMLGRRFTQIAEVVAKETNPVKVDRFFGKKLDKDMVVKLTDAKTSDDVYRVFLEHLGNPTTDPKIFRSTTLRKEALALTANPVARLVNPVSYVSLRRAEQLDKMYSRFFVRSTVVNLGDLNQTMNAVEDWISSAQFKSIIGKGAQEKYIEDISNKLFRSTSEQERSKIIQDGLDSIVEDITRKVGADESTISEIKDVIKLNAVQKNADATYSTGKLSENGEVGILLAGNNFVKIDGGIAHYHLAQGTMFLPDTKAITKTLANHQANSLISKYKAGKILVEEMGDVWRTAQLALRISYIIRNVAEMQMRQLFSGHTNIISHPLQFISMVMANSGRGGKLFERISRYQYDLADNMFKNVDAEGEFLEAIRGYQMWAFRSASVSDWRSGKNSEIFKVYKVIGSGDKNFFEGLAHTVNRWGSDPFNPKIAKLMLTGDEAAKRKFVDDVIETFDQPNSDIRNYVLGIYERNPGLKNIFLKDASKKSEDITKADLSAEKIFTFFFDEAQEHTLAGQMRNIAGNGPKSHVIMDLLADGKVTFTNSAGKQTTIGIPWFEGPLNSTQLSALESAFQKSLKNNFTPEDLAGSRVLFQKESLVKGLEKGEINRIVDWFFRLAARQESRFNFGPEYQMAYWDFVAKYADMLSLDDLKYVQKQANKTLNPLTITIGGKTKAFRKHPVTKIIDKRLKQGLKNPKSIGGTSNWQQIHKMAAADAAKYVKDLFYDASRQKQWAQAVRLVFPFAQAHTNTMYKWGQLGLKNPVPLYRFSKAYEAATKEGSNVIYDVAGVTYDDDQGFIYKNPGMAEPMFRIPLVGSVLGAIAGRNMNMSDALQMTSPVQSLNVAFGQATPFFPGLGPVAQILFTSSGKVDEFGPAWDIMRDLVTPFGAPDSIEDVVFPSWLRKSVLYKMGNPEVIRRGIKDWASYLASSGEYGENPLANDETRNRLFRDAETLSQRVGWMTALFQSISPATPMPEVLAKIKDQDNKYNFMTMTMLYEHWDRISRENPGDYGAAVRQFADTYGKNNILIALGSTTTAVRGTEDSWTWLNNNPDAANKFATSPGDVVPYFFPGGEASVKYYNWQKRSGARRNLSGTELANEAEGLIYAMMKGQIAEEQIANGYPEFWYREQLAKLDEDFGGSPPPDMVTTNTALEKIARVGSALQDPAFKESPIYREISLFYPQYMEFQDLLNKLNGSNYAQIKAKSGLAPLLRDKLVSLGEQLMLENPSFSRMYYGVFAGQLEG